MEGIFILAVCPIMFCALVTLVHYISYRRGHYKGFIEGTEESQKHEEFLNTMNDNYCKYLKAEYERLAEEVLKWRTLH